LGKKSFSLIFLPVRSSSHRDQNSRRGDSSRLVSDDKRLRVVLTLYVDTTLIECVADAIDGHVIGYKQQSSLRSMPDLMNGTAAAI